MMRQPYTFLGNGNDNDLGNDEEVAVIELQDSNKLGLRSKVSSEEIEEYQDVTLLSPTQNGTHTRWKPLGAFSCDVSHDKLIKWLALFSIVSVVCLSSAVILLVIHGTYSSGTVGTEGLDLASVEAYQRSTFPITEDTSRSRCTNNGILFPAEGSCSCFPCYTGPDCSEEVPLAECTINAESGTPVLFEDYWVSHPAPELRIRSSDHLGYILGHYKRLENSIRQLHALVGNAVTDGREIVIGTGSTELLGAAMYAFADRNASAPLIAYAAAPYYGAYKIIANYYSSNLFQWHDGGPPPDGNTSKVLEFIASPNNPDGRLQKKTIAGAYGVFDHAYYWPHFTPINGPVKYEEQDVALFTLSKLTGHAGSRVGWAVVKDDAIASRMRLHIQTGHWYSSEHQLRAINILEYVIATQGDVLSFAYTEMKRRWEVLNELFKGSDRFSVQKMETPVLDTWFGSERGPSPAYLWLHCSDPDLDPDCYRTLADAGVLGRGGDSYGESASYVRLELLMRAQTFDRMAKKLKKLVDV